MTTTESPPTVQPAVDEEPRDEGVAPGIYALVTTSDHKTVGRLYVAVSLLLAAGTAVIGALLGAERLDAGQADDLFGGVNAYFQMWTLYRVGFVVLVAMPLLLGLALLIVPMQVGATNVAFPRAALASFWIWLLGAGITVVAVFAGGGWGALDGVTARERDAIALTLSGTALVIAALLVLCVCLVTTVISLRTSGMNLLRVPPFAWSALVAGTVWLLTMPIALANLALIYFDLRGRDPIAFGITDASIWAQIDWVFTQPALYALLIPVLGVAAEVVPVSARVRQSQHAVLVTAIGMLGLLSLGGWSQPFMTAPADHRDEFVYVAFGIVALLPVLAVLGGLADSLRRGARSVGLPTTMLVGSLGAMLLALTATVAGGLRVIEPFELLERTTTTGLFNAAVFGALLAGIAGIWYWAPKLAGTRLPEGLGRLSVLGVLAGALVLAVADAVSGFFLAPDVMLAEPEESVVEALNVVSFIGAVVAAAGIVAAVLLAASSLRPGRPAAGDDPWDGHTLEWATTSPPPAGNFTEPPAVVRSERPLLDEGSADAGGTDGDADSGDGDD